MHRSTLSMPNLLTGYASRPLTLAVLLILWMSAFIKVSVKQEGNLKYLKYNKVLYSEVFSVQLFIRCQINDI